MSTIKSNATTTKKTSKKETKTQSNLLTWAPVQSQDAKRAKLSQKRMHVGPAC